MTSDQALGDEIAAWVIDHRTELGVSEVLWWQQIWTVERMSEGWRPFPDRGLGDRQPHGPCPRHRLRRIWYRLARCLSC